MSPISQKQAQEIAARAAQFKPEEFEVVDGIPERNSLYLETPGEPVWTVFLPRSYSFCFECSEVIIIGKESGAVLYQGSLGDEG